AEHIATCERPDRPGSDLRGVGSLARPPCEGAAVDVAGREHFGRTGTAWNGVLFPAGPRCYQEAGSEQPGDLFLMGRSYDSRPPWVHGYRCTRRRTGREDRQNGVRGRRADLSVGRTRL